MLFQEKAEKELLERNFRREGAIFEGDESLIWSYKGFSNFELEPLALSRMVNDNWFQKGLASQEITLRAFNRLQRAYLDNRLYQLQNESIQYINVNYQEDTIFNDYSTLLFSMNGGHALWPHNRKYYFNSIEDHFEPIYYDGMVSFRPLKLLKFPKYFSQSQLSTDLRKKLLHLITSDAVKEQFHKRLKSNYDDDFYNKSINQLIANMETFHKLSNSGEKTDLISTKKKTDYSWYIDFQKNKKISQNIVERHEIQNDRTRLYLHNRDTLTIPTSALSKILKKNEFLDKRFTILPNIFLNSSKKDVRDIFVGENIVRVSNSMRVILDEKNQSISFIQSKSTDRGLLLGGNYSNWNINFKGVEINPSSPHSIKQRFNKHGLTGCLTLYKTIVDNTRIKVSDGECEDSLNLINVQGAHFRVFIADAFADALDADFSKLEISNLEITNAGNDCFDVSGGIYSVAKANLSNCNDKGVSIGEKSIFKGKSIRIKGADIGLSSKDFSNTEVFRFDAVDVTLCAEAKQKKQEFGGGLLMIIENNCIGAIDRDGASFMIDSYS